MYYNPEKRKYSKYHVPDFYHIIRYYMDE